MFIKFIYAFNFLTSLLSILLERNEINLIYGTRHTNQSTEAQAMDDN